MKSRKRKSRKRSRTKESYAEQLSDYVFFVDRSSGKKQLAEGLRKIGLNVETHDNHFANTTHDIDWLPICGTNGWIVISSDLNIKRNRLERQVLLSSKVASFFFTSASFTTAQQLNAFLTALKKIAHYVRNEKRPFIARIFKDGKFELWVNHKGEDMVAKKQERQRLRRVRKQQEQLKKEDS